MQQATDTDLIATIQHVIETHHAFLRQELPFLEKRIEKMAANHGANRPELFEIQQRLQDLQDDLMSHLTKEEEILFPYIEKLALQGCAAPACFPSVRFPIRVMLGEHDAARSILNRLKELTAGFSCPPEFCANGQEFYRRLAALNADLQEHIRIENDELFPRAIALEEQSRS